MPQLPPRPLKGEPVDPDWFPKMWEYLRSLELRGDGETTQVTRGRRGTVVRAPRKDGDGNAKDGTASVLVATIDTDNNDGSYDATAQYNDDKSWGDRTTDTYDFDSGNQGNLYELNGRAGVPVGTKVIVHEVEDENGGTLWYFDATSDQYGFEASATNEHGGAGTVGAWVEITGGSGSTYSWKMKDPDASTDASPAVTGTTNLNEVNGREGIPSGSIAWAWYDGTNYQFEYHGADAGTRYDLLAGSGEAAQTDDWERDNQGTDRGVEVQFVTRLVVNSSDEMYAYCRDAYYDANGHLDEVTPETKKLIGTLTPGTVACGTGMAPDDSSISTYLQGWWKADAITGLSDGNSVTTWNDSSGNGNNITQATSSAKPIYKTGIYNSQPTVRFDGTDDYLSLGSNLMTAPFTIFVVAKQTSGLDCVSDYDFTGSNEYGFLFRNSSSALNWVEYDGTYPGGSTSFSGGTSTSLYVGCMVRASDSDREIFVDGASVATNTTTANISFAGGSMEFIFGAASNSSVPNKTQFWGGDICEVAYYNTTFSDFQIEQVSCHLESKWGV